MLYTNKQDHGLIIVVSERQNQVKSELSTISLIQLSEVDRTNIQAQSRLVAEVHLRPLRRKRDTLLKTISSLSLDLFFIALSVPSLLYAFTMIHYDGMPLQENRRTARILIQISRLVSLFLQTLIQTRTYNKRDQLCFH
jgi:hypothetical protein